MDILRHSTNNAILGAPPDWDQGELPCDALPVTRTTWQGIPCIVAFFKPSAEELATLNAGGSIALWVAGHTTAPVMLSTADAEG